MLTEMRDTLAMVFLGMGVDPSKAKFEDAQAGDRQNQGQCRERPDQAVLRQ